MGKERITVENYSHDGMTPQRMEVDAFCVGGNDGVRAYFVHPDNPKWIVLADGDDGNWWYVSVIDRYWIPAMIKALTEVNEDY